MSNRFPLHVCFVDIVTCWPSSTGSGTDVNIEYELQNLGLELTNLVIAVPYGHFFLI
jgi:hypothetical protein